MDEISRFVIQVRKLLNLNQEDFGERFGASKQNVSGWENGRHQPPIKALIAMHNMARGKAQIPGLENFVPVENEVQMIPVIDYVQAGMMTEVADPYSLGDGMETIPVEGRFSGRTFALKIRGESMFPEFKEGDVVVIDPSITPRPGDFVVAKNSTNEATFKKYRPRGMNDQFQMVFELHPINQDFPVMRSDIEQLEIIGVMVEHHRKFRQK
ncbi:LexA family transcriptional regulator [Limnobacter sp.]|uniref:LexA family protein n=1 Tax=Limnobacter sp. TaxID=2003368 RepID=UPI002732C9F9|nr:LexA family transcriptional regulator [Limnobacter sp.]MDP3273419.1 LexA family transcriptional regulator [Limnobacter sp.]